MKKQKKVKSTVERTLFLNIRIETMFFKYIFKKDVLKIPTNGEK